MPRKKTIIEGQHLLFLPKGVETVIDGIVNSDAGYKDKAVWKLKYMLALSSLVERCNESGKEFVAVSQRIQAKKLKVKNGECSRIYQNLVSHKLVALSRANYKTGEHSYEYKPLYTELVIIRVDCKALNKRSEQILSENAGKNIVLTEREKLYMSVVNKITIDNKVLEILGYNTVSGCFVPDCRFCEDLGGRFIPTELIPVVRIMEGQLKMFRPDKKSRIYTNITNLNRRFRPFLRLAGKPLMGIDIANSQPLIAAIIFREYSKKEYGYVTDDVLAYQASCEAGKFYEEFMRINSITEEGRGAFKKEFFGKVFFTKEVEKDNYLKTQFKEKYPTCYEAIFLLKGGYYSKDYKEFAIGMQRIEASIIVEANLELIEAGIDAVNIFDSMYVTCAEHMAVAKQLILDKFKQYDITPMLKVDQSVWNVVTESIEARIWDEITEEGECVGEQTKADYEDLDSFAI